MPDSIGIVAGGGALPARLIEACRRDGRECFVIAVKGQAETRFIASAPHTWVRIASPKEAAALLRARGIRDVVFAGYIRWPRGLRGVADIGFPDLAAWRFILRIGWAIFRDSAFINTVVQMAERDFGLHIVGAQAVDEGLLAGTGVYGRVRPDDGAWRDIKMGIEAAHAVGREDKGQGAVVQQGAVLASEAADGTDAMLARAKARRQDGPGGVLVKVTKPGQEMRIDLPTIGVRTVRLAKDAGLRGIAVEAGAALLIDREAVVHAADDAGLFIVGVEVAPTS